jgi:nickel-dependent lactate racemase
MPYQNIDATLSAADMQAVKDAFAAVLAKLPFLVNLTVDERKSIVKTGSDSLSFVQTANTGVQANTGIFPPSFDKDGFAKDVALFTAMTEIQALAESVVSQLDDTRTAVGGEAMQAAMQAYKYIKTAAETTPGLKPLADQLGERFKKASKPKTQTATPNPPPRTG